MASLGGIGSDRGATGKIDRGAGGFSGVPSRGARSDAGGASETFLERQRRRADLSGFLAAPVGRHGALAPNPELGSSEARVEQARAIERSHGSALAAAMRGDWDTAFELAGRDVGSLLGVTEELAIDELPQALYGTRGQLQPISLLGLLSFGTGMAGAVAIGQAVGPFSGAQAALDTTSQARAIATLSGKLPGIDLGFRPSTGRVTAAQARRAAGAMPTAADQLALDYADRRQASIDAARRQRGQRGDPDSFNPLRSVPMAAAAAPALAPTPAERLPRGFRTLPGRDPRTNLDLLRTRDQAAAAAGLAPARPRLTASPRLPARPGALI